MKEQKIPALKEGTAIDHIPSDRTPKVLQILNLSKIDDFVSIGMNLKSKQMGTKGIIKIANRLLTQSQLDKLSVIAPGSTVNIISDYNVKKKIIVKMQDKIKKVMKCPNPSCITNAEEVITVFDVKDKEPLQVRCRFCERMFGIKEIILK
ncbi:aspartate carbamoyltransferase regulatory subunit [Nanoarchaeota archaeon]